MAQGAPRRDAEVNKARRTATKEPISPRFITAEPAGSMHRHVDSSESGITETRHGLSERHDLIFKRRKQNSWEHIQNQETATFLHRQEDERDTTNLDGGSKQIVKMVMLEAFSLHLGS